VVNRNDGREGDNSEVFDKRYREYSYLNPEILDYYKGDILSCRRAR
jgi:UMP-CMP kinase